MKKSKLLRGLLVFSAIFCLCGCSNTTLNVPPETSEKSSIDTADVDLAESEEVEQTEEISEIEETSETEENSEIEVADYIYPDEFELTDGLKGAIEQLAIWHGTGYEAEEAVQEDTWQDFVIGTYLQGNWDGYDYLKYIMYQQDGIATKEQVEYIQYSLTGIKVDFTDLGENDTVNRYENFGGSYYGNINDYSVQCDGDIVNMSAEFESSASNGSNKRMFDLTVVLQKNPKSCFDGYSIKSLSKEDVTVFKTGDGKEHSFCGWDMDFDDKDGTLTFEIGGSDDDFEYGHFISVYASDEQKKFVKDNPGACFKVTYIFSEDMQEPVDSVEAVDIQIDRK